MKHQNYLFLGGFIQSAVLCVQAKFSFKSYTTVTVYAAGQLSTKNFNLLLTSA
jgi:hypothetical protein